MTLPSIHGGPAATLTYAELEARGNAIAQTLVQAGVGRGDRVVLFMERSLELMAGILGILKVGAAYVPLDTAYPRDRLAYMLEECGARVVVTQPALRARLPVGPSVSVLELHHDWVRSSAPGEILADVDATSMAYVMFTSGSTGKPKGVAVPHRGVVRLVRGTSFTPLDETRIFLQLAPVSFDASTLEIWGPLLNGGRCVLFPGGSVPDPELLERVIRETGVTSMWLTASLFNTIVSEQPSALASVTEVLTGGEALSVSHVRLAQKVLPNTQLVNGYGPTESTTFTTCFRIPRPVPADWTAIPIGSPIANTEVCVLDAQLQAVSEGAEGELCIGGDGLALGYLGRPELTAERFIAHPAGREGNDRLYRTGDRVRRRADGGYDFLGRVDDQIKLRGFRIELGEIQSVLLEHPGVDQVAIMVREDRPGDRRLVAYFTSGRTPAPEADELSAFLAQRLSEVMVPSAFVRLDRLPVTANGKVDRAALPSPDPALPISASYQAPESPTEVAVAAIWEHLLGRDRISVDANFFEAGGSSILAIRLAARLRSSFGIGFPLVRLYQSPTIRSVATFLSKNAQGTGQERGEKRDRPLRDGAPRAIAIIGMAGRFPGARNVGELWQVLLKGEATSRRFALHELDPSLDPAETSDPSYVPVRGIVDDAECFDHAFFGIGFREAEVMDPQQRVFLEVAHEALEDAGYDPERFPGTIGVYAGSGNPTYFNGHLCGRDDIINRAGAFITRLGNEKDFLTTRVSYKLGLRGPAVTVTTACSTSLVAVSQAVDSLRAGHCEMALAGGVSIETPQASGYLYQEGSMLSPDGCCRSFDAAAQGTMFNSGCGIVVLKPLATALADGDRIEAVVLGHGLNNDGSQRMSFSAPTVDGQAAAIEAAHRDAQVEPRTVSYVETHGTATPVGDPIEVAALAQAFQVGGALPPQSCLIGSAKSNLGHLVNAAGVTGLIKAARALRTAEIPGTVYFATPNPELALQSTPFQVTAERRTWDHGTRPRRAGVSSFGVGGTNAHVVLEEPPPRPDPTSSRPLQIITLSGATPIALKTIAERLATHIESDDTLSLADAAYTLHIGRRQLGFRGSVVVGSSADAIARLRSLPERKVATTVRNAPVAFLFPGQGSQYVRMGADLRDVEPVFSEELDRCAELFNRHIEADLLSLLYPDASHEAAAEASLRETRFTQPALFAVGYALARLWMSWGIRPATMVGHSIGELVCACLAGVMSLEDATRIVAARGRLLQSCPSGSMLSVRAPVDKVETWLGPGLDLAAVNAPSLCVVSGPDPAIDALVKRLETDGVACKRLVTSHAFHSAMMDPVVAPFTELIRGIVLHPPTIPFISTVTGEQITTAQATDPSYWGSHVRRTVQFSKALSTLLEDKRLHLVEAGPRITSITCARQLEPGSARVFVGSLGSQAGGGAESRVMLESLGALWSAGVAVDWSGFHGFERRTRVGLPTYPFEKTLCYVPPLPWGQRIQKSESSQLNRLPSALESGVETRSQGDRPLALGSFMEPSSVDTISNGNATPVDSDLSLVLHEQLDLMDRQLELLSKDCTSFDCDGPRTRPT